MPKVSPYRLKPGMILAQPLLRGETVLLGPGTVLTDAWIGRIQDMDISVVHIEGPPEHSVPKEEMLSQLERRFTFVEDKPHMGWLKQVVREYLEGLYG